MKSLDLFGVRMHAVTMQEAACSIDDWVHHPGMGCRYVVTPNTDHVVQLQSNAEFRRAYAGASLVVADGWPVVTASRLLGRPLPEVIPGSSLVPYFFQVSRSARLNVFILGAGPGVAEKAAVNIQATWPNVHVCGCYAPPFGFESNETEARRAVAEVNKAGADLLLIALGAPKQEVWVSRHAGELQVKVALCVGATIDFLAGTKTRAPLAIRRMKLEWLHRLASEPRRLWRRYALDALIFPRLVISEAFKSLFSTGRS